jgi:hypothetical protein
MEPIGSLPYSQQPATESYPKGLKLSPHPHNLLLISILIFSSRLLLVLPSGLMVSRLKFTFTLSLGVNRPGHEADHSPPSSAEVKECVELYLRSSVRLHGVVLS